MRTRTLVQIILCTSSILPAPIGHALVARSHKRAKSTPKTLIYTSTQNFTVPADWDNGRNTIECIGGGAGGTSGNGTANRTIGGGGGGYTRSRNVTLTRGSTARAVISVGGAVGSDASDSRICRTTTNCGSYNASAVVVSAMGGGANLPDDPNGGNPNLAVGQIRYKGGDGYGGYVTNTSSPGYGGAGGGAAGPYGGGAPAGAVTGRTGGGGGNGGGRPGSRTTGDGGTNNAGLGGGAGGTGASAGGAGTNGGGGGGAGTGTGGAGGNGTDLNGTVGSGGGGGGGAGTTTQVGGAGGLYGGGGGGGALNGAGSAGAPGICILKYGGDVDERGRTVSWLRIAEAFNTSSATSISTGPWAVPPAAGNLVVCWMEYEQTNSPVVNVASVTDTSNNAWTRAAPAVSNPALISGIYRDELWYALNISTDPNFNVTVTYSGSTANGGVSCHEYKGVAPVNAFIQANTALASGASGSVALTLPAGPNLVILASANSSGGVLGLTSGYSKRSTMNSSLMADTIVDAAGSYNATFSQTPNGDFQMVALAFRSR